MASSPVDCPGGKASCGDGEGGKRPARRDARVALPSPERSRSKWAVPHDGAHDDAHGCGAPWRAAVDELGRRRRGAGVAAEASKRVDAFRGAPTTTRHKCPSTLCVWTHRMQVLTTARCDPPPPRVHRCPLKCHCTTTPRRTSSRCAPHARAQNGARPPSPRRTKRERGAPHACKCSPRRRTERDAPRMQVLTTAPH